MKLHRVLAPVLVCIASGVVGLAGCAEPGAGANVVASENAKDKVPNVGFLSDPGG